MSVLNQPTLLSLLLLAVGDIVSGYAIRKLKMGTHLKPLEDATLPSLRLFEDICLDATRTEGRRRAATRRVASMFTVGM